MKPRAFAVPRGVEIAEELARESAVLAENASRERRIVRETYPLHIAFIAPSVTLGEILGYVRAYEAVGTPVKIEWIRDGAGHVCGATLEARVR